MKIQNPVKHYNFNAGPAALPIEVMREAQAEFLNWQGCGSSVMEVSHRSPAFVALVAEAEDNLRSLLAIPANYKILFMQGGATAQFSMVPLNLSVQSDVVDYLDTGFWSKKAIAEAQRFTNVNVIAQGLSDKPIKTSPKAAYLHYVANETIDGVELFDVPKVSVPIVSDMSSTILSRPIPVDKFGVIYAGAQKNIGPAGLTVAIVREDLLGHARKDTPILYDYAVCAKNGSMYNTPPTFALYLAALVFRWLKAKGGLAAMEAQNVRKSSTLYDYIDSTSFYCNTIAKPYRSRMNVPFRLPSEALETAFLEAAEKAGLHGLAGHRTMGGIRVSLYNAITEEAVSVLIEFMREFLKKWG